MRLWGPVAVYMALMYVGATTPSPPVPPGLSDKALHLAAYAALAVLVARAVAGGLPSRITLGTAGIAIAITIAYGTALEVRQAFIVARMAEFVDAYFNAAGACVGTAVCWAWGILAFRHVPHHGVARHER